MKSLDKEILQILIQKTNKKESTIRSQISIIRRKFPNCTMNAAAQIYAMKHNSSILKKLDVEDKKSIPIMEFTNQIPIKKKKNIKKIKKFIDYENNDYFINGHLAEFNRAYTSGCYTSAYILLRKITENLLIDILRKKYPESGGRDNKELYYNITQSRLHDFSVILDNLFNKKTDFGIDGKKIIERINQLCKNFKKEANDKVHSWFHLVERKSEFDSLNIQQIFELIVKLEIIVGLKE